MLAWSLAKFRGRTRSNKKKHDRKESGAEVDYASYFLAYLAEVARGRLSEFAPQGISNIAWALATADMLGEEESCHYLTAAALAAAPSLADFAPQAISNLCWAVSRLPGGNVSRANSNRQNTSMAVSALFEAAAQQAMHRVSEFSWQDLSSVVVALSHGRHRSCTTHMMATQLVIQATNNCHKLTTQVMLNIALSATRLSVQHNILWPLVIQIGGCISARLPRVSSIDLCQWEQLQNRCPVSGGYPSASLPA